MPTSDDRPPADVTVDEDADVIVLPSSSGHGSRRRFHAPVNFYTDKPACAVRHQYPDENWKRKRRGVVGGQRSPCKTCYDPSDNNGVAKEKDCPLCGKTVTRLADHLSGNCEQN